MTSQRGFTLIELAIVLVIVTILIGGLAVPLTAQIQARRTTETNRTLEEAREALLGYAMTHRTVGPPQRPYLPCPDIDGDGVEETRTAGACPKDWGWLPWVTLGSAAQDAWGNRLRYAVQPQLTNSTNGFSTAAPPAPGGGHDVCSNHDCVTVDVASDVPVILVSHGPNGRGARNVNNTLLAAPTGANEQENLDADNRYVSRPPTKANDPAGEFDDLTAWMSFGMIVNRVCPAGGCP